MPQLLFTANVDSSRPNYNRLHTQKHIQPAAYGMPPALSLAQQLTTWFVRRIAVHEACRPTVEWLADRQLGSPPNSWLLNSFAAYTAV